MLRERLLRLLHTRSSPRARSHAHGRVSARASLHVLVVGLAALAALLTGRLVSEPESAAVASIPPAPLSGVRAIASTGEAFLRPGVSHTTADSPLRASLAVPRGSLRPTGDVATDDTLTSEVGRAYAARTAGGYEVRALVEQIDPQAPYVVYEVREGDTLGEIAETYDTTVDNILRNNAEVDEGGWIAPGQHVLVPFDTGILYKVGTGETLGGILDDFLNVTADDVLAYSANNLADYTDISPGDYILLPNAEHKPPPVYSDNGVVLGYYGVPDVSSDRFSLPLPVWAFVSDEFGTYRGPGRIHTGIDLALAPYPASSVYAACDGWVSRVEYLTYSYGYYVIVDCGDGWDTLYSHFSEILVSWGDNVRKGETIVGISGSTGYSTGEHLHFEIRYNGAPLNPREYLNFD